MKNPEFCYMILKGSVTFTFAVVPERTKNKVLMAQTQVCEAFRCLCL